MESSVDVHTVRPFAGGGGGPFKNPRAYKKNGEKNKIFLKKVVFVQNPPKN